MGDVSAVFRILIVAARLASHDEPISERELNMVSSTIRCIDPHSLLESKGTRQPADSFSEIFIEEIGGDSWHIFRGVGRHRSSFLLFLETLNCSAMFWIRGPNFQSLRQNFRSHNTCSDGLTRTAANWLEPGYFSQGGKSVVILPNLNSSSN